MKDIVITPAGTVRIKLDEGKMTFVLFADGEFEIQISPEVSPDERYVSFEGSVPLPNCPCFSHFMLLLIHPNNMRPLFIDNALLNVIRVN